MATNVESLGGFLKRIGNYNPDKFKHSFKQRLILQKTVYLMQSSGSNLGYYFSWYVYGPYSSQLAHVAYSLAEVYQGLPTRHFVNPEVEGQFERFLTFIKPIKDDPDWLELMGKMAFLKREYTHSKEYIIDKMERTNVRFTREKCEKGWRYLERFGLV